MCGVNKKFASFLVDKRKYEKWWTMWIFESIVIYG